MSGYVLERTQVVPGELPAVFAFFKRPENLERITPPWLNFRILSSSDAVVRAGTRIRYRLKLNGIPLTWESLISRYEENVLFVDEQLKGPYASWVHTHRFLDAPEGGTDIEDEVRYRLPLDPLGRIALPLIRRQIEGIFRFRAARVRELLPATR